MALLACRVLVGILLLLSAACLMPARAQICPGLGNASVRIDFNAPVPTLDTRRLVDMKTMARAGLGEHQQALGLYKTDLRSGLRVEYAVRQQSDLACVAVRRATVIVAFANRMIYLARELQPGSCRHETTLAHEREHARIDDAVLGRELPKLKDAIAQAIKEIGVIGPVPLQDLEWHRDDINDRLERVFRREFDRIGQIRRREQSRIDTPESYKREAERCPGGLAEK